ncbi:ATP-binding cassette domain-containing protein, partial [Lachnospiraceae bacterium MD308]|nr:ATP-binding cassette domain-containing protein [Lachnospiraceae bacterium MD308]
IQGDIKFENVGFSYLGREKILDKFNLRIYKNQINVILGHSGCGKSTIIKLLTKFWTIEKGTIYLDGVPLDEYSTEYIRNNISIVSQKTEIFQGTIRENIQLDLKIADEKLNEICKRAGIYDEIIKMDNGFETELLGEGNNISGGQRQRIAIARALAKESRIIVFDEPTSNLDIGNVKKICNLIFDIKDRTVILITHDLKLAQKAENICVLDK